MTSIKVSLHRACEGATAAVQAGGRIVNRNGKLFLAAVEHVEVGLYPLGDMEDRGVTKKQLTLDICW